MGQPPKESTHSPQDAERAGVESMSRYSIGDIVRIKDTKTAADGRMAVVVNPGEEVTTLRLVSNTRVAMNDEDKLEPLDESSIYEPGAGAYLADRMGTKAREAEEAKVRRAEAVADVTRRIEIKRRRGILIRFIVIFIIWLICGFGSAVLWTATLLGDAGLAGWGIVLTALGYLVTAPMMGGLIAACADDFMNMKRIERGRSSGKKTDD